VGKVKRLYVCTACGRPSAQWSGKCSACGGWGTVEEDSAGAAASGSGPPVVARVDGLLAAPEERRIAAEGPGVSRVLGGGLVHGSVVLLAGAPGIGKSTLLLQLASRLSEAGHSCLIASGEESLFQVAARARRLGVADDRLRFVPGRDLAEVLAAAETEAPDVLFVDSIQTIRDVDVASLPGGTAQVRGCADALIRLAKERGVTVVLVGHVTKDGDLAGPRTLEHAVDVVLTFEGDHRSGLRVLVGGKNRFGPEGEVAWFEMGSSGLREAEAAGIAGRSPDEPGSAPTVVQAGRRAFAVDVQALVVPGEGPPRRHVAGLDARRFHIVAAATDRAARLRLSQAELYGTAAGGLRVDDPGADLAVAAAIASSSTGVAPPAGWGFVGEVALTGAVRPVPGLDLRVAAAAAAGLDTLVCAVARGPSEIAAGAVRLAPVRHVRDALTWAVA
jgi:DNA repair protein RadA/Sms